MQVKGTMMKEFLCQGEFHQDQRSLHRSDQRVSSHKPKQRGRLIEKDDRLIISEFRDLEDLFVPLSYFSFTLLSSVANHNSL